MSSTTSALSISGTTLGKKYLMAVTGLIGFGFLVVHMIGNLQVFLGPEQFNKYAHTLQAIPALVWGNRMLLLGAVLVHAYCALSLTLQNWSARPLGYKRKKDVATTYAAKIMPYGGIAIGLFIIYHLAHLTGGYSAGLGYDHDAIEPYTRVIRSFEQPWCLGVYAVAQIFLYLHLSHGGWSLLQSLGINHPRYNNLLRPTARVAAVVVCAGLLAVPVGVHLGLVPPPTP